MPKAVKKNYAQALYFTNWKMLWKRRSLRIIRRFLTEGITVNPGQDSIHELVIWKVNPFCRFCNLWQVSNCIQMIGEFLTAIFSKRWNGKYFNGWNFYLDTLQIQENWAGRNFITNSRVYSLLIYTQGKMQAEINNN